MTDQYGTLLDVVTLALGSPLTADVVVGGGGGGGSYGGYDSGYAGGGGGLAVLPVVDASIFPETGGLVRLNGTVYTYTVADPDANTLTLASSLAALAVADDLVEVYPSATLKQAFVDLGIAGDSEGVWATVPQSMVLTLADGLRDEGQREAVLITERSPGELILADARAAASIASTTVIPEGQLDAHQVEVGITGNLVQDPDMVRAYWQPPQNFTIAGPDAVYTDSNYARFTGTTQTNVGHDGGGVNDWDWWFTPQTAIDPGRAVRVKALVRRSSTATTVGGTGFTPRARVRVVFYKSDHVTALSGTAQLEELVLVDDTVADTWTLAEASFITPEGYTHFKAGVQTSNVVAGTVDFIKPEIQIIWNRVQSADYAEGYAGWNFDTEGAQVENLNVLDTVGAGTISAQAITVGGVDLETEYLTALPRGALTYETLYSGDEIGPVGATETIIVQANFGSLEANHLYRVNWQGMLHVSGAVATNECYDIRLRVTADGTTPTLTSSLPHGAISRVNIGGFAYADFTRSAYYGTTGAVDQFKGCFTLQRASGTATAGIYQAESARRFIVWLEDVAGDYAGITGVGSLSQIIKASTNPPDPAPKITYTKSWYATWSRSYDSDLGTRTGDDTTDCYQGYISSTHGNTRSLVGFDYSAIQAALSGATVSKVTVTYRVRHSWSPSAGITVYLGSHVYTAKPSTWSAGSVTERRWAWSGQREGSTYTHDVTALGNELKAGTSRGIAFGPAPSNSSTAYYGYMYGGASSSYRPKLTITYTK